MGFADVWNRTLVYFGIAEEEDWDEDGYLTEEDLERTYSERPNVRRLTPRGRQRDFDDWTDPDPEEPARTAAVLRPRSTRRAAAEPVLAPPNVQVSAEGRARLLARGFFNQAGARNRAAGPEVPPDGHACACGRRID